MLSRGGGSCQPQSDREKSLNKDVLDPSLVQPPGITLKGVADRGFRNNFEKTLLTNSLYDEAWKWKRCHKKSIPFKCLACEREFYIPFRCDLRICPQCNQRYAALFKARYLPVIKKALEDKGPDGEDWIMHLILTTKNTGEIPEKSEIQLHNRAVRKLIRKFYRGGVSVNEVKGTYLHTHCIVYGRYYEQTELCEAWKALTGNEVVYVTAVDQKAHYIANYLCKYLKKPYKYKDTEEGRGLALQFLINFKGVRRVHSYGEFYNSPAFKKEQVCPYLDCSSEMVILQWKKFFDEDWMIEDCKRTGVLSLKQIRKAQKNHLWDWRDEERKGYWGHV